MKQHTGDEIREIMTDMPAEVIEGLQAAHAEHKITEFEARWWGYLMFARTGSYEGTTYTIKVMGDGGEVTQEFLPYVLAEREGNKRHGLVRPAVAGKRSRPGVPSRWVVNPAALEI